MNKILISQDTVRYETDRYTFLKKCHFRNREEDKEENEIYKAFTKEFMRKINLKIEGRYLTPDRKSNIIVNPSLQIDNLGEECNIQFLNIDECFANQNQLQYVTEKTCSKCLNKTHHLYYRQFYSLPNCLVISIQRGISFNYNTTI